MREVSGWISMGLLLVVLMPDAAVARGETTRVSVDSAGAQSNGRSDFPVVNATGRYTAFHSQATNLVAGDTNGYYDVFVHDRQTSVTTRVSVGPAGAEGDHQSVGPSLSADGRFVAFGSSATNLVVGDTNLAHDFFVHDRQTSTTTRVSIDSAGQEANNSSDSGSISADGRYVAFRSFASNLVSGDTNSQDDIFVHDRNTAVTTRVSVGPAGVQSNDFSADPYLSADGRYVVFSSSASNLVVGDTNNDADIFVHDRLSAITTRVSVGAAGLQAAGSSGEPAISADGRYVAFRSSASNLVVDDSNGTEDIFVHDRQTSTTTRVSVDSSGSQGNNGSAVPALSEDGRFVAFMSTASNLVADDFNGNDIFVHDRQSSKTARVSVNSVGEEGNGESRELPSISADGRFVTFPSQATNLVPDDTNSVEDAFLHDRWPHDELTPSGVAAGDRAGSSVDIDGSYAVVGVRLDDHSTYTNAGSAAVYRRHPTTGVWSLIRTLLPTLDSSTDQDKFGHAVALDANTLAVSAENDDDAGFRAGKVYIFGRNVGGTNNWGLVKSFTGTDTTASDYFGRTLALDGDRLSVGAHLTDAGGNARGAVYVFERNAGGTDNWGQTQKLLASDGVAGDRFGSAIGLHGDHIIVGVSRKTTGAGAAAGQAYVFRHNGASWIEQRILLPASGQVANDQYGYSVDINGSTAVVGARFTDAPVGNQTGSAYVYGQNEGGADNWGQLGEIEASDATAGDRFGSAVSIAGNRIVVGSPLQDENGIDAGKVYVYDTALTELDQLTNEQVTLRDEFGNTVATDGVQCLVGSWLDNRPGNNSGGAYRFDH